MANRTIHTVMHLGWVPDATGGYRGQMAVQVKPNGLFGAAYMAANKPLRYLWVYPALLREIEREWRAVGRARPPHALQHIPGGEHGGVRVEIGALGHGLKKNQRQI